MSAARFLPLSHNQQALWFIYQEDSSNTSYNMSLPLKFNEPVKPQVLQQAVQLLVEQHAALRTVFGQHEGVPYQQALVHPPVDYWGLVDATGWDQETLLHAAQQASEQPFDLGSSVFRATLFHNSDVGCLLLLTLHHISGDAASMSILGQDLVQHYAALLRGEQAELAEEKADYGHFIRWETEQLASAKGERIAQYWQKQLVGEVPVLQLPTDKPRSPIQTYNGASFNVELSKDVVQSLQSLARDHRMTLSNVLLSVWQVFLYRYTGQDDIWLGVPTSTARQHPDLSNVVGYLVNPMIMRARFVEGEVPRFTDLMVKNAQQMLRGLYHQPHPFNRLIEQLQPQRNPSYPPLVQTFFAVEEADLVPHQFEAGEVVAQRTDIAQMEGQFDLSISWEENPDGQTFTGVLAYNPDLFVVSTIERMAKQLSCLIDSVLADASTPVDQLNLLPEAEIQHLLHYAKGDERAYDLAQTLPQMIEAQVERTPDSIALIFEDKEFSYRALNSAANQLAHYLLENFAIQADDIVALQVERSQWMVIAMLGVMKAGAAYLPIATDYPTERTRFVLQDSSARLLLSDTLTYAQANAAFAELLPVVALESAQSPRTENPLTATEAQHLAYLIYTSGSTGEPKGVMVEHRGVVNMLYGQIEQLEITSQDKTLQFAPYTFDASVPEVFMGMSVGTTMVLVSKDTLLSAQAFQGLLQQHAITIVDVPPAYLAVLDEASLNNIRLLITAGEAAISSDAQKYRDKLRYVNIYGPTETSVVASSFRIPSTYPLQDNIPIGRPVPNMKIFIVDEHLQLVPIGVPGELVIGGIGVARGYLNNEQLTAEKFVPSPFDSGERLYRTGDSACWLADGNLKYLGRIDHQVKLRGFRIELGDIEAALTQQAQVNEAAVILYEREGQKHLAAYFTLADKNDTSFSVAELRQALHEKLPDYMVPASFTVLEHLPLTSNSKVDRRALPEPDLSSTETDTVALSGEHEQLLAGLWSDVLKHEILDRHANFFASGGHSLLATQLASRIRKAFDVDIPLRQLFELPTLAEQAAWLRQQRAEQGELISLPAIQAQPEASVLSYAQQRLWFLNRLEGQSATYNMPLNLRLKGQLDVEVLRHSLLYLLERHQSLRSCFPEVDGEAQVQVLPVQDPLQVMDLRALDADTQQEQVKQWVDEHTQRPFDLHNEALLRLQLLLLNDDEYILCINMHHIISDGWSIAVLLREWSQAYQAFANDQEPDLAPVVLQYSDYAAWQRQWLVGDVLQRQQTYWQQQLAGAPELLELPTDYPRPAVKTYQGAYLSTSLSAELSQQVQRFSQQQGCTVFMTLLSVFEVLLARHSQQNDLCIGTPVANRTHQQTEDLIGFFVNTLVMRAQLDPQQDFLSLLQQTRQTALDAYAHQDIPFEQLVEQLNPNRSLSHSPLFQVMFVLQNNEQVALELPKVNTDLVSQDLDIARFDLILSVTENVADTNALPQGMTLHWEYSSDLFERSRIERMAAQFEQLLTHLLQAPEQSLADAPLITPPELKQLQQWNATSTAYPQQQTLVDVFEQQVQATPDNLAVVFGTQQLSYYTLNQRANQLAHALIERGVTANTLVGLCVERSLDMIVGLLGILKAGGAYVPLDPDYPEERLSFMLEDSQVACLLTQTRVWERHTSLMQGLADKNKLIPLDKSESYAIYSDQSPALRSRPDSLAYVIYTSGSTGRPKGVSLPHQALFNLLAWQRDNVDEGLAHRTLQFTSLSFDVSFQEIASTWSSGSTLVLINNEIRRDPEQLAQYLVQQQIERLYLPFVALEQLASTQYDWSQHTLKQIITAGEQLRLSPSLACFLQQTGARLYNQYGPSESHVVTQYALSSSLEGESLLPPIGSPIANTRIYVLDENDQPQALGVPGELCIAGICLAQGYFNRPDLTAEKFVEVEISGQVERLYRSGDLACWRADGNLEYLGRIDHQVKLRGFRIELGEIEAALSQQAQVNEAAVIVYETDEYKNLAAYISLHAESAVDTDFSVSELRQALKDQLPDYMLPASFTVLEHLPLTPNGKVDRRALPAPNTLAVSAGDQAYIPPRDQVEWQLLNLWQSVLQQDDLHIHTNFFDAGGHSLLAMRLVSQIKQQFQRSIPVSALFQHGSVAELAPLLRQDSVEMKASTYIPIQSSGDKAPIYLLPGAIGSVLYLQALASLLGNEQPLIALQTPGIQGETTPKTVQGLAEYHIAQLRQHQAQGPYQFIGHSLGGRVVFEMAHQLEREGEVVNFVGIVDTGAPHPDKAYDILEQSDAHWLHVLMQVFGELSTASFVDEALSLSALQQLPTSQAYERVLQAFKQRQVLFTDDAPVEVLRYWVETYRATSVAHNTYQTHGKIRCPIHLFRASERTQVDNEQEVYVDQRPAWGWGVHTQAEAQEIWVPGTHISMMAAPHVAQLAQAIQACIVSAA